MMMIMMTGAHYSQVRSVTTVVGVNFSRFLTTKARNTEAAIL